VGLGGRSSTCCEVGRCEVSGQSDGEVRLRDLRPEKQKKNKQTNCGSPARRDRRDLARRDPLCDLPLPSSFFFLFSFFFNQLQHGLIFFFFVHLFLFK
jgi:hypothetical protein